jgi:CO/xanthine dehydrogenase FAD-binding subunit
MRPSYFADLEGIAEFEYVEPRTVKEACALLSQQKDNARVIAGGTRLLDAIRSKALSPKYLINLKAVPSLDYITFNDEEGLKIGALATLFDVGRSPLINDKAKILAEAIQDREITANRTRWAYYMATLGGSLSEASAAADILPPLLLFRAKAVIEGPKGWKTVSIGDLYTKSGAWTLQQDEVLIEIRVPALPPEIGVIYIKGASTPQASTVRAATLLKLDAKHVDTEDFRIVVGGVGPVPVEPRGAEEVLAGKTIDNDLIDEAIEKAVEEVGSETDPETAERAREVIEESIRQAVDLAIGDFALGY